MAERLRLVSCLKQDLSRFCRTSALKIEAAESAQHEGQEQANFAFTRKGRRFIERTLGLLKITENQLRQTASIAGRNGIVRETTVFGESACLPATFLGSIEFAQRSIDDRFHHMAKHKKARPGRPGGNVSGRAGESGARPFQYQFCVPVSPTHEIGLAKTILGETQPSGIRQSICHGDGFLTRRESLIGRPIEIQRRRPYGNGSKSS